jgi:hypothetical protein
MEKGTNYLKLFSSICYDMLDGRNRSRCWGL